MSKADLIAGLDMGSGRLTCLIGATEPEAGRVRVLGGASVACRGINAGGVVNLLETRSAVEQVLGEAEAAAGDVTVTGVFLGVRGTHLQSCNNKGALNIARSDREITAEDVQAVVANATAIPLSSDQEILHVVPQSFTLDRQRGMPNPVGMEGSTLEVDVHIVTASITQINSLIKSVIGAGFEVVDVVYGLLATGEQLVTPEEKELGTLLVDLGGQSLSLGVFTEGGLRYSKELGIGADYITRDLAVGLHTSIATAERLKIAHGLAHVSRLNGNKEIEFSRVDGRTLDRVKPSAMMRFILPRVEEIFNMVADDLKESTYADLVSAGGLILTGGGSLMQGIPAAAEELLGLQTRVGMAHPEQMAGDEKWFSPSYATAMGLLTYANSTRLGPAASRLSSRNKPVWLRRLMSLLKGLF